MVTNKETLTPNQKARIYNINMITSSIALLGAIGGVVYAKRTGGGFWRYIGYWVVGSLVTGIPSRLVALPFKNAILKKGDTQNQKIGTTEVSVNPETKN